MDLRGTRRENWTYKRHSRKLVGDRPGSKYRAKYGYVATHGRLHARRRIFAIIIRRSCLWRGGQLRLADAQLFIRENHRS